MGRGGVCRFTCVAVVVVVRRGVGGEGGGGAAGALHLSAPPDNNNPTVTSLSGTCLCAEEGDMEERRQGGE